MHCFSFQRQRRSRSLVKFIGLSGMLLLSIGCNEGRLTDPESSTLAQVQINELNADDYDRMELSLQNSQTTALVIDKKAFERGVHQIALTVPPGDYEVFLDYFQGQQKEYSSSFCQDDQYNAKVTLVPGENRLPIHVCSSDGTAINADVAIEPVLVENGESSDGSQPTQPTSGKMGLDQVFGQMVDRASSWYVDEGRIHYAGNEVTLKGINWFGLDSEYHGLHGLWSQRSIDDFLDQIATLGFNALRIPIAPESLRPTTSGKDGYENPVAQLEDLMAKAKTREIYILLDFHTCSSSVGHTAAGPESCSGYGKGDWLDDLAAMAELSKKYSNVVGIDLFNEPYGLTWNQWRQLSSEAAAVVLRVNPRILAFVEGVGGASDQGAHAAFWGENLYEAAQNPPEIPKSRLVFSPHVYGPSVLDGHAYFSAADFPNNMPQIWDSHFGYLKDRSYPLAIGEFGGRYQNKDRDWQNAFVQYLQDRNIRHFFYWSLNPNSGDTGGLLLDDWRSVDNDKLALLRPLLSR